MASLGSLSYSSFSLHTSCVCLVKSHFNTLIHVSFISRQSIPYSSGPALIASVFTVKCLMPVCEASAQYLIYVRSSF